METDQLILKWIWKGKEIGTANNDLHKAGGLRPSDKGLLELYSKGGQEVRQRVAGRPREENRMCRNGSMCT